MKAKGYDLKNTELSADNGKYISFRPIGKDRFVRGSIRSLGKNYTKQYLEYKSYHEHYKNADDKELFFRKYESQLLLFMVPNECFNALVCQYKI